MNRKPILRICDAGGDSDALDLSGATDVNGAAVRQSIDLAAGSSSDVMGLRQNLAIAFGTTIEHAIGGAGTDRITGNASANRSRRGTATTCRSALRAATR